MKKILTIAGSDCSGGAGIQADIKTITMHNMYAMSAITALTAQNTTGVYGIMNSSVDFLKNQIEFLIIKELSMKIESLKIKNYKVFKDVMFAFSDSNAGGFDTTYGFVYSPS